MLIGLSILFGLSILPGLFMLPGQNRHLVDLPEAVHTQAVRITAADVIQGFPAQDEMDTITFQDIIVPAFKFAMAMGTNFNHRNCFSPNNITYVDLAACDADGGPMKCDRTGCLFTEGYKICVALAGLLTCPGS